jgi:hypothetical protein
MIADSLPIRVPLEHQSYALPSGRLSQSGPVAWATVEEDQARKAKDVVLNSGFVRDYEIGSDGALWAVLDIRRPAIAEKIRLREIPFVSPEINTFTVGWPPTR